VLLSALSIVALFAFLGLVVDGGWIYLNYTKLHQAADAAALAAAMEMPNLEKAKAEALEYAALNGFANGVNNTTVSFTQNTTSTVVEQRNWVYVTINHEMPVFFMRLFGFNTYKISEQSAAVGFSFLPMTISGTGVYGTTGIQFLSAFGENGLKHWGDAFGCKYLSSAPNSSENGMLNPEYREDGYDYNLTIPTDYATINNTSMCCVEIFDADCFNANSSGIDEMKSINDAPSGRTPSQATATTVFSVYAPDETPYNTADDTLICQWAWAAGDSTADTDMKWYMPPGFSFDTTDHGPGSYRVNVKAGEGTSNNIYHLRGGPPLIKNSGEYGQSASSIPEGTEFAMQMDIYDWDNKSGNTYVDEVQIEICGNIVRNVSGFGPATIITGGYKGQLLTKNNEWNTVKVDITALVTSTELTVSFLDVGNLVLGNAPGNHTNKVKNVKIYQDGVEIASEAMGSDIPYSSPYAGPSVNAGPPKSVYTLEWEAYSWSTSYECSVIMNGHSVNWESQGYCSSSGTKTYSVDVSDFVGGDAGRISVVDNTHTNTNKFRNMVLKKDGAVVNTLVNGAWAEPTSMAADTSYAYSGLGSDAGWGEGSQFNSDNGTGISGISALCMQYDQSGTVTVCLGDIPPEAAGVNLHIEKFDTDVGAQSITYWDKDIEGGQDTISGTGTLTGNGLWKEDIVQVPVGYPGGTLYASYQAGKGDTSTWFMWFENSIPGVPGRVRLVK
jgi:hypothetical protein